MLLRAFVLALQWASLTHSAASVTATLTSTATLVPVCRATECGAAELTMADCHKIQIETQRYGIGDHCGWQVWAPGDARHKRWRITVVRAHTQHCYDHLTLWDSVAAEYIANPVSGGPHFCGLKLPNTRQFEPVLSEGPQVLRRPSAPTLAPALSAAPSGPLSGSTSHRSWWEEPSELREQGTWCQGRDGEWQTHKQMGGGGGHGKTERQVVDGLRTEVCGQQKQSNDPHNNQHNPNTPTTGRR